jgi:4'-phosphopantetheinyl transferase
MSSAKRTDPEWVPAPTTPMRPASDEVAVWRIALAVVNDLDLSDLSADERDRANGFQFDHVRSAFIQGRLFLRRMLARLLARAPTELEFRSIANGKPTLANSDLAFNLSHSGGEAVLAVAGTGPVGVDIEVVSEARDLLGLADRYFSPDESKRLRQLPEAERVSAFYRCWTRKEAFIKALGEGLSRPLDSFSVAFEPNCAPEFLRIGDDPTAPSRWRLFDLELGGDLAGAVATVSAVNRIACFTLERI